MKESTISNLYLSYRRCCKVAVAILQHPFKLYE